VLAYEVSEIFTVFISRPAVSVVVYIDILPAHFIRYLHGIITVCFKHMINNNSL